MFDTLAEAQQWWQDHLDAEVRWQECLQDFFRSHQITPEEFYQL